MTEREAWLNGWQRRGTYVYIGPGQHCAGCGRTLGLTTVVFEDDYESPAELPNWPFEETSCPVCGDRDPWTGKLQAFESVSERKPNLPGKLGRE